MTQRRATIVGLSSKVANIVTKTFELKFLSYKMINHFAYSSNPEYTLIFVFSLKIILHNDFKM
jgi:hypothetical protein